MTELKYAALRPWRTRALADVFLPGRADTREVIGAVRESLESGGTPIVRYFAGIGLEDDVNVNIVHPGQTHTERLEEIIDAQAAQTGQTKEQFLQAAIDRQGIRRLGTPEDVAEVVAFLCSPKARHIQGTAIAVDGGGTKGLY